MANYKTLHHDRFCTYSFHTPTTMQVIDSSTLLAEGAGSEISCLWRSLLIVRINRRQRHSRVPTPEVTPNYRKETHDMHEPHAHLLDESGNNSSNSATYRKRSPIIYFILTFSLSIPFWVVGALINLQLLPGVPVSALSILCPVGAASILVHRENGIVGVAALLKRSFDFKLVSAKMWYLPALLLMPCIMVLSYIAMHLIGIALPAPQFSFTRVLTLFVALFIAAACEELGWSGYAIDPLQVRFGALHASLSIGVVWAVWHLIPLVEVQRSPTFIAWWSLATVAYRVIITWLYNNVGRSVFVAALFHTMSNLTWQLFPIDGSYYDPRFTGSIAAIIAVVVVIIWGPRRLVRA